MNKNCICEACCNKRDLQDDKLMKKDYDNATFAGKDIFNKLKIGDHVRYYNIPYDERYIVYLKGEYKWNEIREVASTIFNDIIISKTDHYIKTNKHILRPGECWNWGLHIIND